MRYFINLPCIDISNHTASIASIKKLGESHNVGNIVILLYENMCFLYAYNPPAFDGV